MSEPIARGDSRGDSLVDAPRSVPKAPAVNTAELIRQKRTFRVGIQVAPVAACIAAPAILASVLDPDFLWLRSLQLFAVGGIAVAAIGLMMLFRGMTGHSRRVRSYKFWLSVFGNVVVIIAVMAAAVHSYRWGHPPPTAHAVESGD